MRIEVKQRDSTINVSTSKGKGPKGDTPYIQTGTWWISGEDTGITAVAQDGVNPEIGQNGNWYIGNTDTGVTAQGPAGDDAPIPEFRTYYPPPVIADPTITTSVTDSTYTTNFNQAVQQPGVFQWKYTNEADTEWRDQYPVAALTDSLDYFLVKGDPADLQDVDLIQQITPVASGTDVSQLSANGGAGESKNINVYVKDQAGNVSLYSYQTIILLDPELLSFTATPDSISADPFHENVAERSGTIEWIVETDESEKAQMYATPESLNTSIATISNIVQESVVTGDAAYPTTVKGTANYEIIGEGITAIRITTDFFSAEILIEVTGQSYAESQESNPEQFEVV